MDCLFLVIFFLLTSIYLDEIYYLFIYNIVLWALVALQNKYAKKKRLETVRLFIVNEQSQPVQKKKKVNKYANLINNQNVIQKLKDFGQSNKIDLNFD